MDELSSGRCIMAKFNPRRVDDLKPDALPLAGAVGEFEALWVIDDGDYEGEWAMLMPHGWRTGNAIWCPSGDLTLVSEGREA